ncbi:MULTISPECIES: hypothetical protein [unclassified Meiothermus]|uniref:hypothetical protein n=1 Tax=unclassified Meiothermus TaxID=370471 RepID=UPI000D7C95B2|nr:MULTISPECIES: hypothetical protein [unclassified Meiothermus]PZA08037.1 hypothetical protein DNA98_07020 [Meiothermus sp. Pnk-1]RYM32715.1 hypothetical protein EWH23_13925 [Meiothermus sp. PNK-Is4]
MEVLLPIINDWFAAKREHLTIFARADCRLEGWFKGELLVLLSGLQQRGKIEEFDREVNIPSGEPGKRFQVDFRIRVDGRDHLCELKALCISQAAGTPRNLRFYFRDDHVGLVKDMKKLERLSSPNRWLIAFVYPVPSRDQWAAAVAAVPASLAHCRPLNEPNDLTAPLFVSLWHVGTPAG